MSEASVAPSRSPNCCAAVLGTLFPGRSAHGGACLLRFCGRSFEGECARVPAAERVRRDSPSSAATRCLLPCGSFFLRSPGQLPGPAVSICLQVREDVTRYRYGDEQHLDEALTRIFR